MHHSDREYPAQKHALHQERHRREGPVDRWTFSIRCSSRFEGGTGPCRWRTELTLTKPVCVHPVARQAPGRGSAYQAITRSVFAQLPEQANSSNTSSDQNAPARRPRTVRGLRLINIGPEFPLSDRLRIHMEHRSYVVLWLRQKPLPQRHVPFPKTT